MEIGNEYDIIQKRTGFSVKVRILKEYSPNRWVGLILSDLPHFSAGGQTFIEPEDVVLNG